MKVMGYWPDNLCPCCRKVPESSTIHLFLCDNDQIATTRETEFNNILLWLSKVHTSPDLLHIITSFWQGTSPSLDNDDPYVYRSMYNTLQELGVASMWMGLLPTNMVNQQDQYYKLIGSNATGAKWASTFVGKMLRATLKLWLTRNEILHLTTDSGIRGSTLIELKHLIQQQLDLGVERMEADDHYLMDITMDTLLEENVEGIRGWLCSVLIARGDTNAAREESIADRGILSHTIPRLTAGQQQELLDWRRVKLNSS